MPRNRALITKSVWCMQTWIIHDTRTYTHVRTLHDFSMLITDPHFVYLYLPVYVHPAYVQPAYSPFSTRRICSRDAKRKQEFSNVIGWRKSSLLRQPITLSDSCFRFASREQIRLVENGLMYRT